MKLGNFLICPINEIEGLNHLKELVFGSLQLVVETFNFLQYSQIEINRGFPSKHSKITKIYGYIQWVTGFLVRRLLTHIHSLIYTGPEIDIPLSFANQMKKPGNVPSRELRNKFKAEANFNELPKIFISIDEIREIAAVVSQKRLQNTKICTNLANSSYSSRQLQKFKHIQAVMMLQSSLMQQLSKSSSLLHLTMYR